MIEGLNQQFGIQSLPYLLIQTGKEKIRGFSGHLSKEEIKQLTNSTNIESLGLYMLKLESQNEIRLTLDACHLLKKQIKKNIVEINNSQLIDWLKGEDLNIQTGQGSKIIRHNEDFFGYGKSTGNKILNYIPKSRRLK